MCVFVKALSASIYHDICHTLLRAKSFLTHTTVDILSSSLSLSFARCLSQMIY